MTYEQVWIVTEYDGNRIRGVYHSQDGAEGGIREIPAEALRAAPPAIPLERSCVDCGVALNEGEAKVFTVCDNCWAKAYGRPKPAPAIPEGDGDSEAVRLRTVKAGGGEEGDRLRDSRS